MTKLTRRNFVFIGLPTALLLPRSAAAAQPTFYRSPGCGCCHVWTKRMAEAGLPVLLEDSEDLSAMSEKLGVPAALQGCHVGEIDGYVISGHVPPREIKRLLAERPAARGLVVPGMPVGSPGMEADGQTEPYDVLLLLADGTTQAFASYS